MVSRLCFNCLAVISLIRVTRTQKEQPKPTEGGKWRRLVERLMESRAAQGGRVLMGIRLANSILTSPNKVEHHCASRLLCSIRCMGRWHNCPRGPARRAPLPHTRSQILLRAQFRDPRWQAPITARRHGTRDPRVRRSVSSGESASCHPASTFLQGGL